MRNFIILIWQSLVSLLNPVNHGVVTNACESFNGSKIDTIEIEFQGVFFDLRRVALQGVSFTKLAIATPAEIVLDTVTSSVLDGLMIGLAV